MENLFFVFHDANGMINEPEETRYKYELGEEISVNNRNNRYKCVKIENVKGKVLQHFKQAKIIYTYDY